MMDASGIPKLQWDDLEKGDNVWVLSFHTTMEKTTQCTCTICIEKGIMKGLDNN